MQILWNGEPSNQFSPQRGIRQGDPLSTYLFVLRIERLAHCISYASKMKKWKPVVLNKEGPPITHLFFADDLFLFLETDLSQAETIKMCLNVFCSASGQKVCDQKTRVFFSRNINHNRRNQLSEVLGFQPTNNLGKYLGVPLHHKRISKQMYKEVVDRVQNKITSWGAKTLALASRITLSKAILASIPLHSMQTALLPTAICSKVDKLIRNFL